MSTLARLLERLRVSTKRVGPMRFVRLGRWTISLARGAGPYRSLNAPPEPKPGRAGRKRVAVVPATDRVRLVEPGDGAGGNGS